MGYVYLLYQHNNMYNFNICKKFIFFIILFFAYNSGFTQNSNVKIDSITRLINESYSKGNIDPKISLKNITDLYYLSQEADFIPGKLRSIVEQASIYYRNGNSDACLEKINEGIDLAKSRNDYNTLCSLLLIYQKLLYRLNYLKESKQALAKCEGYNKLVKNENEKKLNTIYILLAKAEVLVNNEGLRKDMAPVLSYKKQAYSEALTLSDSDKYKKFTVIYALESLAWSTTLAYECKKARSYTYEIDRLLATYPNEDLLLENLIIKGATENLEKNYKPAISYLSEAILKAKQGNNLYKVYEVYPMISASFGQLEDYKQATIYSYKFKHMSDSINLVAKRSNSSDLISKINLKIAEENNFTPVIITAIVIILLAIGGYLLYKKNRSQSAKQKQPTENLIKITADKQLENSKKLVSLAKADINVFYIEFQKMYPAFYQTLKDKYDLNISDLNFCALIKMNFEIKQIAVFTNSTLRSVESRRYRIIKKMDLKSQNDLYIILSKLS